MKVTITNVLNKDAYDAYKEAQMRPKRPEPTTCKPSKTPSWL